jgi:D-cysteine desulfhydrase
MSLLSAHGGAGDPGELMIAPSPISCAPALGRALGVELRIKRDDLLPIAGGGNKARKAVRIMQRASAQGCNAVVTTGGVQSNHARAVALMAAQRGWRCRLILHGDEARGRSPQGNLLLMHLANASTCIVPAEEVAARLDLAMADLLSEGYRPSLIPGGGHTTEGALAYVDAAAELVDQCGGLGWMPATVVLASGTGTTQAGLVAGLQRAGADCQVIGVSIARKNPRGADIVQAAYEDVCRDIGIRPEPERIVFLDDWVGEGYEHADRDVLATIANAIAVEGLILDPTYTGKAFRALPDMIASGRIAGGTRVLFWHTGGIFNLMASEYWSGAAGL